MLNWEYISPQPDILPVHFFVASFKLKYTDFINASSVGCKERGCLKMVKILSSASFCLKKEKTEIKSRQNGIIEL